MSMPPLSTRILSRMNNAPADLEKHAALFQQLRQRIRPAGPFAPAPREYYLRCPDDTPVYCQEWVPPSPRAVLLCQHGNGVHGDLFVPLADVLYHEGIAVIATDNRGHGRSGPFRGHNDKPAQMNAIYSRVLRRCARDFPGAPSFFLGESLGTCLVAHYVTRHAQFAPKLKGVIFMVSPLRLRAEYLIRIILPIIGPVALFFHGILGKRGYIKTPEDYDNPTYLPEFNAWDQFDRVKTRVITAGNVLSLVGLILSFRRRVPEIQLPMLVLQGTGDKMVDPAGTHKTFALLPGRPKKLIIYPKANHSLFMDQHSQRIYGDIVAWIKHWSN